MEPANPNPELVQKVSMHTTGVYITVVVHMLTQLLSGPGACSCWSPACSTGETGCSCGRRRL
jgi:hypothetical protein